MESTKQSYTVRFRKYVAELSKTHEYIETKKRTYEDTFGEREYNIERYGQEIDDTFFHTNIGHAVIG
jgi:hypothetical protein